MGGEGEREKKRRRMSVNVKGASLSVMWQRTFKSKADVTFLEHTSHPLRKIQLHPEIFIYCNIKLNH